MSYEKHEGLKKFCSNLKNYIDNKEPFSISEDYIKNLFEES